MSVCDKKTSREIYGAAWDAIQDGVLHVVIGKDGKVSTGNTVPNGGRAVFQLVSKQNFFYYTSMPKTREEWVERCMKDHGRVEF